MSIGEFTMVNSYYSMAFGCFKYYLNYFKSYQDARASFDRLEALSEGAEDRGTISVGHVESISLSNIAYRYAGKPYLYRDLSVEVERGDLCHYRAERMRQKHVSEGASWTIFCWGASDFGVGAI